ncbi:hypothetical protein ZYGR_0AK04580 [Zygosaccharomyces rouxii]|uniref:Large ribosomal subunit protein mL38 n=1 Tax=Zygosaccharomyces rouxii TaxID=4956 RepID=A0A1Q3ADV6_ZYGRO|nr:hypothetical protein ZYGR_0AK04580 [Zygosaccharomyces rouxii]
MLRRSLSTSTRLQGAKVWSDFSGSRPQSFSVPSSQIKKCILEGTPASGPPSLRRRFNRVKYTSPEHIDETFKLCYDFVESKAAQAYEKASKAQTVEARERLLAEAELHNPEVLYNFQYHDKLENDPRIIDYEQPVYRLLGKQHWESYGQMLLMQRLESLAVIPDTLPTLVPRTEINIRFPFSTGINKWVEPGEILSTNATSLPPVFKIQEYEPVDPDTQYTILVVNPDEPDLANDSFSTTLCYGLTNVKVSYNDNIVDSRKFGESNVLVNYLPPVPEKNVGNQRFAVWVFRQRHPLEQPSGQLSRANFDIRSFAKAQGLIPVGAHVWRSHWDSQVKAVRAKYGLPEGRIFSRVRT